MPEKELGVVRACPSETEQGDVVGRETNSELQYPVICTLPDLSTELWGGGWGAGCEEMSSWEAWGGLLRRGDLCIMVTRS